MILTIPIDETKNDVCVSFGRTPYFMIYNTETDSVEIVENPAADAESGAGPKAAQLVIDLETDVLITVRCGENAAEVMKAADIKIYKSEVTNAMENVKLFKENKLAQLNKFHAGFHGA